MITLFVEYITQMHACPKRSGGAFQSHQSNGNKLGNQTAFCNPRSFVTLNVVGNFLKLYSPPDLSCHNFTVPSDDADSIAAFSG